MADYQISANQYPIVSNFFKNEEILMIRYERQQEILKILNSEKTATIKSLATRIFASESSVRRDLITLEKSGYVNMVYGGVVLSKYKTEDPPVEFRQKKNAKEKEYVAKMAAKMIFDGATIIMDSSSTVARMCKHMKNFKNLKIITNNVNLFSAFDVCDCKLYCTGGRYSQTNKVLVGNDAINFLQSVNADLLFFSAQAVSQNGEITDSSEEETAIRRTMLKQANKKIFLCDYSKIGKKKLFAVCGKNDVDKIICDKKLPWEE